MQQHSPLNSAFSRSNLPTVSTTGKIRRNHGLDAGTRDKMHKQMSFMKIQYNYERFSRLTDEISVRRQMINDLLENNESAAKDIPVPAMMNMNVFDLHAHIEQKKIETVMNESATKI